MPPNRHDGRDDPVEHPPLMVTAATDAELDEGDPERARPVGVDAWRATSDAHPAKRADAVERAQAELEARREEAAPPESLEALDEGEVDGLDLPDDTTPEITGEDASADEAAFGDAGNGVAPMGADLIGRKVRPLLEDEPDHPGDIVPDDIETMPGAPPERSDEELTAQPTRPQPTDPSEWP